MSQIKQEQKLSKSDCEILSVGLGRVVVNLNKMPKFDRHLEDTILTLTMDFMVGEYDIEADPAQLFSIFSKIRIKDKVLKFVSFLGVRILTKPQVFEKLAVKLFLEKFKKNSIVEKLREKYHKHQEAKEKEKERSETMNDDEVKEEIVTISIDEIGLEEPEKALFVKFLKKDPILFGFSRVFFFVQISFYVLCL